MSNEIDYKILSEHVYLIDKKDDGYDPNIKEGEKIVEEGINYQILKTKDNTSNGMQAMAVAPVKEGKADTSEVVIAYAGTNFSDEVDVHTDLQTVIGGNSYFLFTPNGAMPLLSSASRSQNLSAAEFAEGVKTDYPNAKVTTTGHSLGEYLALYVSAENGWGNVGFNGPDPYDALSPEAISLVLTRKHTLR